MPFPSFLSIIEDHNHGKEKNGTQYKNDLCLTLGENIEKYYATQKKSKFLFDV